MKHWNIEIETFTSELEPLYLFTANPSGISSSVMIKFCFMLNVVEKRNLWQEFIIILCDLTLGQTKLMSMNVVKIKNNRKKGNRVLSILNIFHVVRF